jgi:hypothetical protein
MDLDIKTMTELLGKPLVQVLSEPGPISMANWKNIQITLTQNQLTLQGYTLLTLKIRLDIY